MVDFIHSAGACCIHTHGLGAVTHFVDDDPLDNYIWSITIHLWTINLSERCFHWDDWLAFFPQLRSGFG